MSDHRSDAVLEQAVGAVLGNQRLRRERVGAELANEFHGRLGVLVIPAGRLLVLTDDIATKVIHDVEPTILIVGGVHGRAIELALACLGDGLGGGIVVVPGPVVGRIGNAALVKDRLVIDQRNGVVILRHGILLAVEAVEFADARIVVFHLHDVGLSDIIGQVQQHVVFHVHLSRVGVHPEDVRQRTSSRAGFQQSPVLVPSDHLDVDVDTGLLGPQIRDGLQAFKLNIIPDLDLQNLSAGSRHSQHETQGGNKSRNFLHELHNLVLLKS